MGTGYEQLPPEWATFAARLDARIHPSRHALRYTVLALIQRARAQELVIQGNAIHGISVSTYQLAEDIGRNQQGAWFLTRALEKHGWLTVTRHKPSGRGRISNTYDLHAGPPIPAPPGRPKGAKDLRPRCRRRPGPGPRTRIAPIPWTTPTEPEFRGTPISSLPGILRAEALDAFDPDVVAPATPLEYLQMAPSERQDHLAWLAEEDAFTRRATGIPAIARSASFSDQLAAALRSAPNTLLGRLLMPSVTVLDSSDPRGLTLITQSYCPAGDHRDVARPVREQGVGSVGMMAVLSWIGRWGHRKPLTGIEEFCGWVGFRCITSRIRAIWSRLLSSGMLRAVWKRGRVLYWVHMGISWEEAAKSLRTLGFTRIVEDHHKMLRRWWDEKVKGVRSWVVEYFEVGGRRVPLELSTRVDMTCHQSHREWVLEMHDATAPQVYVNPAEIRQEILDPTQPDKKFWSLTALACAVSKRPRKVVKRDKEAELYEKAFGRPVAKAGDVAAYLLNKMPVRPSTCS